MVDSYLSKMRNVRIAFGEFNGNKEDIFPGYQHVNYRMIFDIKMGENLDAKQEW